MFHSRRHVGPGPGRETDAAVTPDAPRPCGIETVLMAAVVLAFFGGLYFTYGWGNRHTRAQAPVTDNVLTRQQVDTWYAMTDGPNAADVYNRAFATYVNHGMVTVFQDDLPEASQRLPETLLLQIEDQLRAQAPAIRLLEQATRIDTCRFEVREDRRGQLLLTSHHGDMLRGAHLLQLTGVCEFERDKTHRAAQRVAQLQRMAAALIDEPVINSTYLSCRIHHLACDLAERLVVSGEMTDRELALLKDVMDPEACRVPKWHESLDPYSLNTCPLYRTVSKCKIRTGEVRRGVLAELERLQENRFADARP